MANTISINLSVSWKNDDGDIVQGKAIQAYSQIGNAVFSNVQTIGASSEAVTVGEVDGDCFIFFKNNNREWSELSVSEKAAFADKDEYDEKNTVYVGTTNPMTSSAANSHRIKPGFGAFESGILDDHFAIRDTADVDLFVAIIEK